MPAAIETVFYSSIIFYNTKETKEPKKKCHHVKALLDVHLLTKILNHDAPKKTTGLQHKLDHCVQTISFQLPKIHFNTIPPFIFKFGKRSLPSRFSNRDFMPTYIRLVPGQFPAHDMLTEIFILTTRNEDYTGSCVSPRYVTSLLFILFKVEMFPHLSILLQAKVPASFQHSKFM
jgi:hypothetical protein